MFKELFFVCRTGEVVACYYDQEGENVAESLQDWSLKEIWHSDNYKNLRSRIDNAEKEPDTDYICAKLSKMDKGAG